MEDEIIVETFWQDNERSRESIRLRPLPGQVFSEDRRVYYSRTTRYEFPPGTLLRVWVKLVELPTGGSYLRLLPDVVEIEVTRDEAEAYIRGQSGKTDLP
jgi:hypothetical protein